MLRIAGQRRFLAAYQLAAEERYAKRAAIAARERLLRKAGRSSERVVHPVRAARVAIGDMLMRVGRWLTGVPAPASDSMPPPA